MMLFSPSHSVVEVLPPVPAPASCELLSVIDRKNNRLFVLIYRPPDCSVTDTKQLFMCIESLILAHREVTVMGDFNFPNVHWSPVNDEFSEPTDA
jgi:hypothetical protein